MPSMKSDVSIKIRAGNRTFTISGVKMLDGRYKIKRGRSWSEKLLYASASQIFAEARKWVVKHG